MRNWCRLFEQAPLWGISLSSNGKLDVTSLTGPWYKPEPGVQCEISCSSAVGSLPDPQAVQSIADSLQQIVQAHTPRKQPKAVVSIPSSQVISQSHRLQDTSLCAETPEALQAQAAYAHQMALEHWPSDATDMALDYHCEPATQHYSATIEWVACHQKWIQAWDQIITKARLSPYRIEPEHQAWWRVLQASHDAHSKAVSSNIQTSMIKTPQVIALLCCEHYQLTLTLWLGRRCLYRHHNTLATGTGVADYLDTLTQHLQRARVTTGVTHWSQCYLISDLPLEAADQAKLEDTSGLTLMPLPYGLHDMNQLTSWGLALQGMQPNA